MKETKQASGSPEAQAVVREMMAAFEAFKGANDARLDEIERKSSADALLEEKVARIDQAVGAAQDRLERLEKELSNLLEQSSEMTAKWQAERDKLEAARDVKEQLDKARAELDQVKREGNLGRAGELSYGIIPGLEKKLAEAEEKVELIRAQEGRAVGTTPAEGM